MARRRRFSRKFAGTRNGRRFFWYRFTPFGMQLREASTATHSDILISESEWQDPQTNLNEQTRGGARLERAIFEFGLALDGTQAFYSPGASANIAIIPEFMVWQQSDQFVTAVTSSTTFNLTRQDQRIIMDTVPMKQDSFQRNPANDSINVQVRDRYQTKTKVRLGDKALGVAWRGLFNTGDANLTGYTDWFRPTLLISLP